MKVGSVNEGDGLEMVSERIWSDVDQKSSMRFGSEEEAWTTALGGAQSELGMSAALGNQSQKMEDVSDNVKVVSC